MVTKINSLSKNNDFISILKGKKITNKYATIFFKKLNLKKNNNNLNVSFITKKKLGNAVFRNKIKRRLRNIMIEALKKINLNYEYSYLFIAKKNIFHDDYRLIKENIFKDLKKIKK
ncbi:MAG: ribonuclease P protein component [Candidatus Pelagibacter sp.]|nr:ribonuclease P protein component [Candidatus Pelagibacter sp.]|tara:strand:+ start:5178 stop:5525 length:348 start_codon:yes stop_codon:yes gene_type:complete